MDLSKTMNLICFVLKGEIRFSKLNYKSSWQLVWRYIDIRSSKVSLRLKQAFGVPISSKVVLSGRGVVV